MACESGFYGVNGHCCLVTNVNVNLNLVAMFTNSNALYAAWSAKKFCRVSLSVLPSETIFRLKRDGVLYKKSQYNVGSAPNPQYLCVALKDCRQKVLPFFRFVLVDYSTCAELFGCDFADSRLV